MRTDVRKLSILAMLAAMAYIMAAVSSYFRIPIVPAVPFLRYDPKDVIIVIGGFLYGPLAAFAMTAVVAFVEMFTVSVTGFIGLAMNIVSGTAFACTAAFIYKKKRTLGGAIVGLVIAALFATAVMLMYNYLIAPIFLGWERERVAALLIPGFLPFNLISNFVNAALVVLLYKPMKSIFTASRLMPKLDEQDKKGKINAGVIIAAIFVIATCVLWWLTLQGRI